MLLVEKQVVVGQVALSIMGRDKGNLFVITNVVNEEYVQVADGMVRKISKPKLKKIKHLKLKPFIIKSIADKLNCKEIIKDSELANALKALR